MTAHTRVSGVWKEITGAHTRVSGVWKEITAGHVKVSGVWKQFYTNAVVTLSGEVINSLNATAGLRFNADGTVDANASGSGYLQIDSSTDWVIPNGSASSSYEVRATLQSGDTPDTGTLNTWLDLGTDRAWTLSPVGTKSSELLMEVRLGGTTLDSGTYTLNVTVV